MKTKTIKLYNYDELSKEAYKKAYEAWRDSNNLHFLSEDMHEHARELLKTHNITGDPKVFYSLSYSQGDGVMFEGVFEWGTWRVNIKHGGHYYHSNSKTVEMYQIDDDSIYPEQYTIDKFEAIYQKICTELEKYGYKYIEDVTSEEAFKEDCTVNEFTFRENGKMEM